LKTFDESAIKKSASNRTFSIVLPTVGRSELLEEAIQSVLWQSFSDLELIVSDNSANGSLKDIVGKYAADERVRYVRPESQLSMPDNWEFATRHTAGRYVLILTDREIMRPSALRVLHQAIQEFYGHDEVIFWYDETAYSSPGILSIGEFTGSSRLWDSKRLAEAYAGFDVSLTHLPRASNSCYRADVAERIRGRHGRMFFPLSPDYTSAFLLLAYTNDVVYLDRPLSFLCVINQSNNVAALIGGQKQYVSTLGVEAFTHAPFPLNTVTNFIVDDLFAIQKMVGGRLSSAQLGIENYLLANYKEIIQKEEAGSLVDLPALFAQWWEFVGGLPQDQQSRLRLRVKELDANRNLRMARVRRVSHRLGIWPYLSVVRRRIRRVQRRITGQPVYSSALDAAMKTDSILTRSVDERVRV
jgi:glycosyltransferase involved in cell wall biosynthesis